MKNIRYDFLTKNSIIYAKKREDRPNNFKDTYEEPIKIYREDCPFCPGNENQSTEEVIRFNNTFGVKIINNKYPVVSIDEDESYGHHYVIIEDKNHNGDETIVSKERFYEILKAYKIAVNNIEKDKKIHYVQIFKNCKRDGGASLEHPHSQIIALKSIPNKIKDLCKSDCELCKELETERDYKERIVAINKYFIAYAPYASTHSYQLRIVSLKHTNSVNDFNEEELGYLAEIYVIVMNKLRKVLGNFPYNIAYYSLRNDLFHFFIDIYPRKVNIGGFELSSGMLINSKLPEEVVKELNNV